MLFDAFLFAVYPKLEWSAFLEVLSQQGSFRMPSPFGAQALSKNARDVECNTDGKE
jgi:hypothetical protein